MGTFSEPFTVDRFANDRNKKVKRFNSKFFEKNSEGVDALSHSWEMESYLLVPPTSRICEVIKKLTTEHVLGTMVVPYWPSADYWPLLKQGEKWENFVVDLERTVSRGFTKGVARCRYWDLRYSLEP